MIVIFLTVGLYVASQIFRARRGRNKSIFKLTTKIAEGINNILKPIDGMVDNTPANYDRNAPTPTVRRQLDFHGQNGLNDGGQPSTEREFMGEVEGYPGSPSPAMFRGDNYRENNIDLKQASSRNGDDN